MELSDWSVEGFRLTAFSTELPELKEIDWWEKLLGEPAESSILKVREGQLLETGIIGDDELSMTLNANRPSDRIDWTLGPPKGVEGASNFGEFPSRCAEFSDLATQWLEMTDVAIVRMAFGAILSHEVKSIKEGYDTLNDLVPGILIDTSNWTDFMLRFNLPTDSRTVDGLALNCMRTLAVAQTWTVKIKGAIDPEMATEIEDVSTPAVISVRLDLDVNTHAARTEPIPADNLSALFRELVEQGQNVASHDS